MKTASWIALNLMTIPFGAYGRKELLRGPKKKVGLPIASEGLCDWTSTLGHLIY